MARYGAKHAMWAPFKGAEPSDGMPVYDTAEDLGGINESNDTINFAEASAYADNAEKIYLKEFTNGTIASRMLHVPFNTGSKILGTSQREGAEGRSYGGDDDPPLGGYGFYSCYIDANKKRTYGVIFYPKVQGSVEGSNYKTKEDGITFEYDALAYRILLPNCGKYKIEERFDTEEEAIEYLEGLFSGASPVAGVHGSGIPMGADAVSIAEQEHEIADCGNVKVSELIGPDVAIEWKGKNGTVTGEIKKKESFDAFDKKNPENQTGHYFPFAMTAYKGQEVTCEMGGKSTTGNDGFWTLRLDRIMATNDKTVVLSTKTAVVARLDFSGATMAK